jgi:3-isopropylmalate/(R)-2-methylmalate dehydratase large subunit
MGMTMAEKILARASGQGTVHAGEFVTAEIDVIMGHDRSFPRAYEYLMNIGIEQVADPDRIVVITDHRVPAMTVLDAEIQKRIRSYVAKLGIRYFYDAGEGICHTVLPEKGHALPGRLIVGGDSHTTTYGALGAASCGLGFSELAYAMCKGRLWFQVPETIRFVLNGKLGKGITSKDVMLRLLGDHTAEVAQYKAVEIAGPVASALSVDGRMTMSNMGVEMGAKFAFFEADDKTVAYLKGRSPGPVRPFGPDADASYLAVHTLDVTGMEPQVALPHNPDNVKPISQVGEIRIQQAFIGSCTNSRTEDLERAASILKGRKVHPGTRLLVIPGSREVLINSTRNGVIQILAEAGAMIATPGCGPCGGGSTGVLAPGENGIACTNRNFKGRMGSPESFNHLASPETVAASAIEGRIADPRKYLP